MYRLRSSVCSHPILPVEIAEQYKFDGWLINIESPFATSPLPAEYKAQQMVK